MRSHAQKDPAARALDAVRGGSAQPSAYARERAVQHCWPCGSALEAGETPGRQRGQRRWAAALNSPHTNAGASHNERDRDTLATVDHENACCDPDSKIDGSMGRTFGQFIPVQYTGTAGPPSVPAAAATPRLALPSTSAESSALLTAISAKFKANPRVPVEFSDRGLSVVIMPLPEAYVVQRGAGETFTESAIKTDTPAARETVINTNLYESTTRIPGGLTGPADLSDYRAQGQIVRGGTVVGGRSSPDTYYIAWTPGRNASEEAMRAQNLAGPALPAPASDAWQFGKGDPPKGAEVAFGGAIPVIANGLAYGVDNRYKAGAPPGLPAKGDPGAGNEHWLLQRSNSGFAVQEGLGAQLGKVVIGINREAELLVIVVEQHDTKPGMKLSEIRNSLVLMGISDAVAWDGSDSATLVKDATTVSKPGRIKNNTIPAGLGLRVK